MLATPVTSMNSDPADERQQAQSLDRVQRVVGQRPPEQPREDRPELGEQQRDGGDAGRDVEALGEAVEPGRSGRPREPRRRLLDQVRQQPGEEADEERDAEQRAEGRRDPIAVARIGEALVAPRRDPVGERARTGCGTSAPSLAVHRTVHSQHHRLAAVEVEHAAAAASTRRARTPATAARRERRGRRRATRRRDRGSSQPPIDVAPPRRAAVDLAQPRAHLPSHHDDRWNASERDGLHRDRDARRNRSPGPQPHREASFGVDQLRAVAASASQSVVVERVPDVSSAANVRIRSSRSADETRQRSSKLAPDPRIASRPSSESARSVESCNPRFSSSTTSRWCARSSPAIWRWTASTVHEAPTDTSAQAWLDAQHAGSRRARRDAARRSTVCRSCAALRATSDVPVILLTARAEEIDRIVGLELGADDYVVKPFSPRELAVRVRTVLRRSTATARRRTMRSRSSSTDSAIDLRARQVSVDGTLVALTPKEYDLLSMLARSPRQVFSRAQLLDSVWASSPDYPGSGDRHRARRTPSPEAGARSRAPALDPDGAQRRVPVRAVIAPAASSRRHSTSLFDASWTVIVAAVARDDSPAR